MLPAMLRMSKCLWLMFHLLFKISISFLHIVLLKPRASKKNDWLSSNGKSTTACEEDDIGYIQPKEE
jgi:hypothetical protein